jgi:hypothetical protein
MNRVPSFFKVAALPLLAMTAVQAQTPKNTLTAEETAAGYQLLFNGTDFSGWRAWNSTTPPNSWAVVAESTWNVIKNGAGSAGSVPLVTNDTSYQNFDFKVEFLVPSAGNAGIFIRYNQYNKNNWGGASGPETQIAAINNSDGTSTLHRMGTCYDMFPLQNSALNWDKTGPSGVNYGVYHQLRIIAFNNHVVHYGNGLKLVEYDMTSSAYNTAFLASKYATYPIYKTWHPGGMYLQHHGENDIRFRNIRIKKLTDNPWAQGSTYLSNPADSTSGLKATMTFDDNLFPTGIVPATRSQSNLIGARLLQNGGDYSLLLDRSGNFTVRVEDLRGRTSFSGRISNDNQVTVPAAALKGETRILRVVNAAGNQEVYRQLVSPVR